MNNNYIDEFIFPNRHSVITPNRWAKTFLILKVFSSVVAVHEEEMSFPLKTILF